MLKVFKRAVRSRSGAALIIVLGLAFVFCGALYVRFSGTGYLILTAISGLLLAGTVTFLSVRSGVEKRRLLDGSIDERKPAFHVPSDLKLDPSTAESEELFRLGIKYYHGQGVEKDFPTAFRCFHDSAVMHNREAEEMVGVMYLSGIGVGQNTTAGREWLEASAFQGQESADARLGKFYSDGAGFDRVRAEYFLGLASARGDEQSKRRLENMKRKLHRGAIIAGAPEETAPEQPEGAAGSGVQFDYYHAATNSFIKSLFRQHERSIPKSDLSEALLVLNAEPGMPLDEIRRSYLRLIAKYHPDRAADGEREHMENQSKKVTDAWETVRAAYGKG